MSEWEQLEKTERCSNERGNSACFDPNSHMIAAGANVEKIVRVKGSIFPSLHAKTV